MTVIIGGSGTANGISYFSSPTTFGGTLNVSGTANVAQGLSTVARGINNASIPAGTILQVKQTAKTDTWSASPAAGSFSEVTGFSVSLTPTSTSSKILVMVNAYVGRQNYQVIGLVKRNGSTIALGDANGTRPRVSFHVNGYASGSGDVYQLLPTAFTYLDSPSTVSACNYTVELSCYSGNAVYVNRSYTFQQQANDYDGLPVSTITVMEIAH